MSVIYSVRQELQVLFKEKGFNPTPEMIEKMKRTAITKQQLLFFALCSDTDRDMILGKREMSVDDFDRLACLIHLLGLSDLGIDFEMKHKELLKQVADKIEYNVEHDTVCIEKEQAEYNGWLDNFINQLPAESMKKYIRCIFAV